jgi:hypothetical protein
VVVFAGFVALFSPALEDPLFPPLMFSIFGIAWVLLTRGEAERPPPVDRNEDEARVLTDVAARSDT